LNYVRSYLIPYTHYTLKLKIDVHVSNSKKLEIKQCKENITINVGGFGGGGENIGEHPTM
jgi:hypothetical protein